MTKWEVVAVTANGRRRTLGFTARLSRQGLLNVARQHGTATADFLGLDADRWEFVRDGAGRWTLLFGAKGEIKFSGRTERDANAVAS